MTTKKDNWKEEFRNDEGTKILVDALVRSGVQRETAERLIEEISNWWLDKISQQNSYLRSEVEKMKNKWTICTDENCDNKEECERANHYIETIWNPTFEDILKMMSDSHE